MKATISLLLTGSLFVAFAALNPAHADVDVKQAEALMKANKCSSCHHATKTKSGPSLKKIAADYKGKADAEQTIITQITTGPMVEIDGEEEELSGVNYLGRPATIILAGLRRGSFALC